MRRYFGAMCVAIVVTACGGGGGGGTESAVVPVVPTVPTVPAATSATLLGKVRDASTGLPIAGASVKIGSATSSSGIDGSFFVEAIPFGRIVIEAASGKYATNFRVIAVNAAQAIQSIDVELQPVGAQVVFDPSLAQTLKDPGSAAAVVLSAGSLVGTANALPVGSVTANITAVVPRLMPGDFTTNTGDYIETFGAVTVQFLDSTGTRLNLAAGTNATIRIPATGAAGATLPSTIPLYYLNEATGLWVKEGAAQLVKSGTITYYEGKVSHFSSWNADDPMTTVFVKGTVVDADGVVLSGVTVQCTGIDYNAGAGPSKTEYLSGSTGSFSVPMKKGGKAECVAVLNGVVSNRVIVQATDTGITLSEPLVLPVSKLSSITLEDSFKRVDTYPYPFGGSVIEIQVPFETVGITLDWNAITIGQTHWEVTPLMTPTDGLSLFDFWKDGNGTYIAAYRIDDVKTPAKGIMSFKGTFRVSEADNRNNKTSITFLVRLVATQTNAKTGLIAKLASEYRKFTISLIREPVTFAGLTALPMYDDGFTLAGAQSYCSARGYRVPTKDEAIAFFPAGPYGPASGSGIGEIWTTTLAPLNALMDPIPWVYTVWANGIISQHHITLSVEEGYTPRTLCVK